MDGRWSGRKDVADPMLIPRKGATESPTCPTQYLLAHNYFGGTETLVRKPRANPMHGIYLCVRASSKRTANLPTKPRYRQDPGMSQTLLNVRALYLHGIT